MDVFKILAELRAEREKPRRAILVIEGIAATNGKRRGRPPKWMSAAQNAPPPAAKEKQVVNHSSKQGVQATGEKQLKRKKVRPVKND